MDIEERLKRLFGDEPDSSVQNVTVLLSDVLIGVYDSEGVFSDEIIHPLG